MGGIKPIMRDMKEKFNLFGGKVFHTITHKEPTGKYECENCGAIFKEDLEICEVCGL